MKKLCLAVLFLGSIAAGVEAQGDYLVGPQDVLTVTVFGEPELSGKFPVEQDGTFAYPQLGRLPASGLTLRAIERVLRTQLSDGFLKNPQVSVIVESFRSQHILIMGEVRSPGEYQLTGQVTLLSALARAGGPAPGAGHEIVIVRQPPKATTTTKPEELKEAEILRVDLAALEAGDISLNLDLQDGDAVNLPKAQSVFVTGQVRSPGAYAVDRGTTILQVLSLAGGVNDRGADGRIRILRTVNGKKVEIKAKLGDTVEPGDTVVVPERFF